LKDTDLVEDAKYVGNASFLKDMPDKLFDANMLHDLLLCDLPMLQF
jgi:hypothetical protein